MSNIKKTFKQKLKEKGIVLSQKECDELWKTFEETLFEEIGSGQKVTLFNVGVFQSNFRKMNNMNNMSSGKLKRLVLSFKTSTKLKAKLNEELK